MPDLNPDQFDYRMKHRPDETGHQLHAAGDAFPDIYAHPEYYHHGDKSYTDSLRVIKATKGKPDAMVNIYRSVPHGVKDINPGDWVSTSRDHAHLEGMHATDPKQDLPVLSAKVPAKHLRTEGNDVNEWGYYPDRERGSRSVK